MNLSALVVAEVPPLVVTVMFTVPEPAGLVAVIFVPESAVIEPPAPPKLTPVARDRFVPVMDTEVPPAVGPLAGEIPVTTGRGVGGGGDEAAL